MPKELFNQPLIETPSQPDDNDRFALSQPSVTGGKNILWSYLKQLLQGAVDWLDFTPQPSAPAHQEGRTFYDDNRKVLVTYNDISDVALDIGQELWGRVENDNAYVLENGKVGCVKGASIPGGDLLCDLADAADLESSSRTLGLFTNDIAIGGFGYITRYGVVRGVDTSMWTMGDLLYLDAHNPGELTNTRPISPHYPVRIGVVMFSHATLGAIGVDTLSFNGSDTDVAVDGLIDGVVIKKHSIVVSVSGGIIYADVTNEEDPTHNLPFIIDGVRYALDTTTGSGSGGAARIAIPPGASATETQASRIYIRLNAGVPELAIVTAPISEPYANLGAFVVFDDVRTLADGQPFSYRRANNAVSSEDIGIDGSFGLLTVAINAIRFKLGSNWLSGQDATPDISNTSIRVALSAGLGAQLHVANLPAFDGLKYLIYNTIANLITYEESLNLTDIVADAAGNTLLSNNTFYTIRLYYQLNSQGIGNNVIATRPLGSYSTSVEAIQDPLNYTVQLADTDIEEVIYPIYEIVIGRTGGGGATIALVQLTDLRSKLAGQGGGGSGQGSGTDDKIRISATDTINSYLNDKLTVLGGLVKSIINPAGDEVLQIELPTTITGNRIFTGQSHGGDSLESFSASKTFDANNGNNQKMLITADTTIGITNELAGTFIFILEIDTATPPTITIGASFGSVLDNSVDLINADNDINILTLVVDPDGIKYYTINTKAA